MNKNELYHYGVLGMKWGRRKAQPVSDKELAAYRKKKISEAPSKKESSRGANKGWWKNAPKSVVRSYYEKEQKQNKKQEQIKNRYSKEISAYNKSKELRNQIDKEGNKLIKLDKRLSKDFGGKHENVDDFEFFDLVANEYGLNTDNYSNSFITYSEFRSKNSKSISKGRKVVEKYLTK